MNLLIGYDKCSTCKKAEKWLSDNQISFTKRPIKEEHPSAEELRAWQKASGIPLKKFFNTSGMLYREMNLKDKIGDMNDDEIYALLATDGMLVKRPILVGEDFILLGFKEPEWQNALKR
ncbi:MAG: arsenate reductase family protein [Lachnospiraceae bacterium]|nr:arsenate reductase family protein [Lachnospiraceae bacterium]